MSIDGRQIGSLHLPDMGGGEGSAEKVSRLFALILFLIIALVLLFSLVIGTGLYRSLIQERADATELRLGSSLLANSIRMNDGADSVAVGTGPEGPSLVLLERLPDAVYETRIYAYRGSIMQEYALAGSPYAPDRALHIVESEIFDFECKDGLLTVHTDTGATSVALRSARTAG